MSMKDGPFKRAYLQIGGATGWAPFEKVWELLKHTLYILCGNLVISCIFPFGFEFFL